MSNVEPDPFIFFQACPRPDRGKDPLTYLYIKLLFVKLIKLVYDKPIIYKRYTTKKISGYFSKLHLESCINEVVQLF